MKYYTGVGNRDTPNKIIDIFTRLASKLEDNGYILRSGGAYGADYAFYNGLKNKTNSQIFVPWEGYGGFHKEYNIPEKAFDIVSNIHPNWNNLSNSVKTLHARNVLQVLGPNLDTPSSYLVCYTRDGAINKQTISKQTGGTATAIAVADIFNIPVFNLKLEEHFDRVISFLE